MSVLALAMRRPGVRGSSSLPVLRLTRAATCAQRAWMSTERGSASAGSCAATAIEALEGGVLLDTAARFSSYHLCVRVLILSDAFEAAGRAIAALDERVSACAAAYQAELALRTGRVSEAERWAHQALELARGPQPGPFAGDAAAALVSAHAERGAFREAHELLRASRAPHSTRLRHARARLMLAEGRFEDAYAEACEVGARRERQGRPNPTWDGWRSTAALALAHLGRREEATKLAETELARARSFGAPVPIARAMAARAVAEPDHHKKAELCVHALSELGDRPAGLESVGLRIEHGIAATRAGNRAKARKALRAALAEADRAGASLLAQRARRELGGVRAA